MLAIRSKGGIRGVHWARPVALLGAVSVVAACASSPGSSGTSGSSPSSQSGGIALGTDAQKTSLKVGSGNLAFDVFAPFSGPDAIFGVHALPGAQVGAYAVNQLGGVLGHKFTITHTDSRGDPADAVPAIEQAIASTKNLTAVLGPTSDESLATVPILRRDGIPTFNQAGSVQLDNIHSKWVYRILASDSEDGAAMAYQAVKVNHYTKIALVMGADAGSQSLVLPIKKAVAKLGATVVSNESLTPDQPSYRTQVLRVLSAHPQVILTETDDATAATLWSQMYQLNHNSLPPIIGSGPTDGQDYWQAVSKAMGSGTSVFDKQFSAASFSTVNTCATPTFLKDFHAVYPHSQPVLGHVNYYDTLVLIALAMLKAHSVQPDKWMPQVRSITNSTNGTQVCTLAQGEKLIKEGKPITYIGTKGSMRLNDANTVTIDEEFTRFGQGGSAIVRNQVPARDIRDLNNGI